MTMAWFVQLLMTVALGSAILRWSWRGFSRGRFGLRVLFGWTVLGLSFPVAALLNRLGSSLLHRLDISATGLLFATFAIAMSVALAAITDQLSESANIAEVALVEAIVAHEATRLSKFISDQTERADGLVVVPALNEELSLSAVINDASSTLGWPVLVVDDGSTDATSKAGTDAGAFVARIPRNLGVGAAVRLGLRLASMSGVQRVIQLDADGQHPASEAKRLLLAADVIGVPIPQLLIGSRFADPASSDQYRMGTVRRVAIQLLRNRLFRRFGVAITDPTSGLRLFNGSDIIDFASYRLPSEYLGDTYGFLTLVCGEGFVVHEVAVSMRHRQAGLASSRGLSNIRFLLRALVQGVGRRKEVKVGA